MNRDTFCSYCGHEFPVIDSYPKSCSHCHRQTFLNAPTVGVGLVPINDGLLVIRRAIEPMKGQLALPGGYKTIHETWEACIAREVMEETGIIVDPVTIWELCVQNATNGSVLVFGLCAKLTMPEPITFTLDNETEEALIITEPVPLAFPTHQEAMKAFFKMSQFVNG